MEIIKDDKFQLPIEMLEEENRFQQIVSILKILEEKRAVISLRFGLNEGEPQTLEAMKKMRKIFKIQKFVPQIYKDRPDRIPKFFAGQTL
ncbi:MAG: hypothetical protein HY026_09530 [Deltaproteobacteria bacterium]|nr:hypothetical protein [Deltaproteobacteria bacterium]